MNLLNFEFEIEELKLEIWMTWVDDQLFLELSLFLESYAVILWLVNVIP